MTTTLNIRLPDEEAEILAAYAKKTKRTRTDIMRAYIRTLGETRAAEPKVAPVKTVGMGGVWIRRRLRALRPALVKSLAQSMKIHGLLHPIVLQPRPGAGYWFIDGVHRFEAARRLKWTSIQATIVDGPDADRARLIGIDEALAGVDLTEAERALHLGERKKICARLGRRP